MSKRSYRSNGKGKRKKAPASNPELADIPAGLSPTGEVAPRQAGLAPTGEEVPRQPGLPPMEEVRRPAHGKRGNPPQSVNGRAPRFERCVGQAPPEDGELTDVSGDGNGESLPPSVDGRRGDLSAPGGPRRNPLVLPGHLSSSASSSVPPEEEKYGPLGGHLALPGYPSPSSSPARPHSKRVRPVGDAREEKYGPLRFQEESQL